MSASTENLAATPSFRWSTREIVVVAAIGAAFAVLYLGWVQVWLLTQGLFGPLSMDVMFGFWFLASPVAAAIIRKPGAAFIGELLAAAIQILIGNPSGVILLLTGAVQGAGAELPLALTRWRNYRLPMLMAMGGCASVFSFAYTWISFDYGTLAPGVVASMFVLRVLSGMLLGGLLGHFLVARLYKTGVLRGFEIDRQNRAV